MSNNAYIRKDNKIYVEYQGELLEIGQSVIGVEDNNPHWCLFGVFGENLLVTPYYSTNEVTLQGKEGYKNGVEVLNNTAKEMCKDVHFAESIRSIDIGDINALTDYDPVKAGYGKNTEFEYMNEVTFYWDGNSSPCYTTSNGLKKSLSGPYKKRFWYPISGGYIRMSKMSKKANSIDMEKITTLINTGYSYRVRDYIPEPTFLCYNLCLDLLFGIGSYWLATPVNFFMYDLCNRPAYGLQIMSYADFCVHNQVLYSSYGFEYWQSLFVRPIVTLSSKVKVTLNGKYKIKISM